MIRVILSEERRTAKKAPSFLASWEGMPLCRSSQPILEAARELERKGYGHELMTARHAGKECDSIKPALVGDLAKLTISEGESGLKLAEWKPRPELEG